MNIDKMLTHHVHVRAEGRCWLWFSPEKMLFNTGRTCLDLLILKEPRKSILNGVLNIPPPPPFTHINSALLSNIKKIKHIDLMWYNRAFKILIRIYKLVGKCIILVSFFFLSKIFFLRGLETISTLPNIIGF